LRHRGTGFQAHGHALGGCQSDVCDLVGVVAAYEREERNDDICSEHELDEDYSPTTVWHGLYDGVYGSPDVFR
jgi:hypothetical protein